MGGNTFGPLEDCVTYGVAVPILQVMEQKTAEGQVTLAQDPTSRKWQILGRNPTILTRKRSFQ